MLGSTVVIDALTAPVTPGVANTSSARLEPRLPLAPPTERWVNPAGVLHWELPKPFLKPVPIHNKRSLAVSVVMEGAFTVALLAV